MIRGRGGAHRALLAMAVTATLATLASGCERAPSKPDLESQRAMLPAVVAKGAPIVFAAAREGFGIALPPGCTDREPTLRGLLSGRSVYFVTGENPHGSLLLLDRGEPAAVALSFTGAAFAAPLFDPAAPLVAHDGEGFRGLYVTGAPPQRTVILTRGGDREILARGDLVAPIDFRCRDGACGVLLPRVAAVAQAGLSLFLGGKHGGAWARYDVDLSEGEVPVGIPAVRTTSHAFVASSRGTDVMVREIDGTTVRLHEPLSLPFGVLETAVLGRVIAVGHGAQVVGACAVPRPSGLIVRSGLPPVTFPLAAPLQSVVVRPLELGGAPGGIVVYSAPLRCHDDKRRFVTAMLLDGDGAPRGGGMVVAEGQGFAVSTRGDELDLVVLQDREIVVARARCR